MQLSCASSGRYLPKWAFLPARSKGLGGFGVVFGQGHRIGPVPRNSKLLMRIQHIEFLPGLVVLPVLVIFFLLFLRWKRKVSKNMGDTLLVKELVKNHSSFRTGFKFSLALIALAAILVGSANIQKPGKTENVNRKGVDIMLVLDVSKSMLAEDIRPSRLEKAKQLLIRLLDRLNDDRVGLVLFAGRAYLQMPLTVDQGAARMYIQDAGPEVVPTQGTVIGEALQMANNSFNAKERKYKAIVLVSDGEDHDPNALKIARDLASQGVMINTVGIGTPEGSVIVDPVTKELKKDENGQTVISKLNEAELGQLADLGNGIYIRLDNLEDALITLSQRLDGIEKRSLTDTEFVEYKNFFPWFLGLAFVLLVAECILSEKKFHWI
jgi:Ca-activated chloride channel family protein